VDVRAVRATAHHRRLSRSSRHNLQIMRDAHRRGIIAWSLLILISSSWKTCDN